MTVPLHELPTAPREETRPFTLAIEASSESRADLEIQKCNLKKAQDILLKGVKDSYIHDPDSFHHLALKLCALPLYQLAKTRNPSDNLLNNCRMVYEDLGSLLEFQLNDLVANLSDKKHKIRIIGEITETTLMALSARSFSKKSSRVLVPASREEDMHSSLPFDFIYIPLPGKVADDIGNINIQAKTKLSNEDLEQYKGSSVALIALNQICPYYRGLNNPDSLARTMLRELSGEYTPDDQSRLDRAYSKMQKILL